MDYEKINFKCGLEIHRQLDTKHKLFCKCSTGLNDKDLILSVKRKQHAVASELGEVDAAAKYEFLRDRTFYYQVFPNENCLVECDEEPIKIVNQEALEIALQIALLFNCTIPDEIHVMRKTVIDGSNTSGFQRTMVVGLDGFLEYKERKVGITYVSLEEDAASIMEKKGGDVTYKLNRLGIPLIEIGTDLMIGFKPEEVQDIAGLIGMVCRSTGKVKRGIGTVRQDVNVSVKNGGRVEIKGVQELRSLSKVIDLEIKRQVSLSKVKEEVRTANPDGTTKYIRPLPGAARLYPETDTQPILLDKGKIEMVRKKLPELWSKKIERFKKELKLSDDLAKQILKSDYLDLFEKLAKRFKVQPSIMANVFCNTLKDLKKRENVDVENLKDKDFEELFGLLEKGKIVKESIPEIISHKSKKPEVKVKELVKKLGLGTMTEQEILKIVKDVIKKNKDQPMNKIIGIVMSKVRGKAVSSKVIEIVKNEIKKIY